MDNYGLKRHFGLCAGSRLYGKSQKNRWQDQPANIQSKGTLFHKAAFPVKARRLNRSIHKDIGEQGSGNHGLYMIQQLPADTASLMFRRYA